jgi:hypothetical protein
VRGRIGRIRLPDRGERSRSAQRATELDHENDLRNIEWKNARRFSVKDESMPNTHDNPATLFLIGGCTTDEMRTDLQPALNLPFPN